MNAYICRRRAAWSWPCGPLPPSRLATYIIRPMHLVFASGILDLGESPSSFGQTLALLITFLGIGVLVNGLIVYVVAQVMVERRQNQERQRGSQAEPPGGLDRAL